MCHDSYICDVTRKIKAHGGEPFNEMVTLCNILQHHATPGTTQQHPARLATLSILQHSAPNCDTSAHRCEPLAEIVTRCNTLQRPATLLQHPCNTLQHPPTPQLIVASHLIERPSHCDTLQHAARHCHTLQHTAAHCNTLQHFRSLRRAVQ